MTAHSRKKREPPPADCRGLVLKSGSQPSIQPSDYTHGTTKIEGLRQANSNSKEGKRTPTTTHSPTIFRSFSLSLTLLLFFIMGKAALSARGRGQRSCMIYDHFRISDTDGTVLDISDILKFEEATACRPSTRSGTRPSSRCRRSQMKGKWRGEFVLQAAREISSALVACISHDTVPTSEPKSYTNSER